MLGMNKALCDDNGRAAGVCWLNGEFKALAEAQISVLDHGLLYGDGIFEGLRFYGGRPFKLSRHLERLNQSAKALCLNLPYTLSELAQAIEQGISYSALESGYVRLVVTRGEGDLGINPKHCPKPTVFMIFNDMELVDPARQGRGLSLITASTKRVTGSGLDSRVKSLNYLHSILAKTEANHAGADDAVLLNSQGFIAECSAANIFIVSAGQLVTPPVVDGALEGITRETVIELAQRSDLCVKERSISQWDVYNAEECFITGSAARLLAVASLDGRALRQVHGPIFTGLFNDFMSLVRSSD